MRALTIGRFQPFHNGHLDVIKEIREVHESIVIVIGSAQHSHSVENPFTAGERYMMIANTLENNNITNYHIIPIIDINRYALWVAHIASQIPPFDMVYTHNPLTRRLFTEKDYKVAAPKIYDRATLSGREVRRRIIDNESWQDLVPKEVVRVIEAVNGVERLRELARDDINHDGAEEGQI